MRRKNTAGRRGFGRVAARQVTLCWSLGFSWAPSSIRRNFKMLPLFGECLYLGQLSGRKALDKFKALTLHDSKLYGDILENKSTKKQS